MGREKLEREQVGRETISVVVELVERSGLEIKKKKRRGVK